MLAVSCILLSSAITVYLLVTQPSGQERNSCITLLMYAILCSVIAGVMQPLFYWSLATLPSWPLPTLLLFPLIVFGYITVQGAGVSLLTTATSDLLPISYTAFSASLVGLFVMVLIQFICQVLVVILLSKS